MDRDWYHERDGWRRPRRRRASVPEWIRNLFAALGVLALVGWTLSTQLGREKPAPAERARLQIAPEPERAAAPTAEPVTAPEPRVLTRETSTVYRCIVDGRVVYSGPNDCRGSMPQPVRIELPPVPAEQPAGLTEYQRDMLRSADARIAASDARSPRAWRRGRQRPLQVASAPRWTPPFVRSTPRLGARFPAIGRTRFAPSASS
ncbi:hypothetical protein [Piscinibacter koreensis]|nr:hypothetical protein [Schlegelella koreensis]